MMRPERTWLLFAPHTPTAPSSLRVTVWRRMQSLGGVTLANGVWVLPQTNEHEQAVRQLLADLERQGGNGLLLIAQGCDQQQTTQIIERFQVERTREYTELAEHCTNLLQELEKETLAENFTFAELEENEGDWQRLLSWYRKIRARDFFPGPRHQDVVALLRHCQQALRAFTIAVYQQEGLDPQADEIFMASPVEFEANVNEASLPEELS